MPYSINWHKQDEIASNYFLNLEKSYRAKSHLGEVLIFSNYAVNNPLVIIFSNYAVNNPLVIMSHFEGSYSSKIQLSELVGPKRLPLMVEIL